MHPEPSLSAAVAAEPLGSGDREQLARALELRQPLRTAGRRARAQGAMFIVFGALTALFALPGLDLVGLALGAVLVGAGWIERRHGPRLAEGEHDAPRWCAGAELAVLAGVVAYGGLQLVRGSGAGELEAQLAAAGAGDLGLDVAGLTESVHRAIYLTVIAVALLYQGGMALYFLRRRSDVAAYRAGAPEWARAMARDLS